MSTLARITSGERFSGKLELKRTPLAPHDHRRAASDSLSRRRSAIQLMQRLRQGANHANGASITRKISSAR